MDLIEFAIVGRAITPTELQPPSTRVLSPQTSHRTSLIDSVCCIAGIFIGNLPPGYVSACVFRHTVLRSSNFKRSTASVALSRSP